MKKWAGLLGAEGIYQVDHLGVVCIELGIPLLFTEEKPYLLAKHYYPELQAEFLDSPATAPDHLAAKYEMIFFTNFCGKVLWEHLFNPLDLSKKLRSVYCPHGNSDKGQAYPLMESFAEEDIVFIYGQRMIDFLKEKNVFQHIENYILTGNYRYSYYQKRRDFYDALAEEEVFSKLPKSKKNILYAPTWNKGESSFFSACARVCNNVPEDYNLIVKLHPAMEVHHLGSVYKILAQYEHRKDILFLREFPLIYPLLAKTDIYIGDLSSIGYDFLVFNKPMFFLNEFAGTALPGNGCYLFQCGVEIPPSRYSQVYSIIQEHLPEDKQRFTKIREQTYNYTFGEPRSFASIKTQLMEFLNA